MKKDQENIKIILKECPTCEKGKLLPVNDIISELSGYVFVEKGERCDSCGEEFPYQEETQKTIQAARKLAIWPETLKLHRKLSKSGRGIIFRIPSDIEKQLNLNGNEDVDVSLLGNKIIIKIN